MGGFPERSKETVGVGSIHQGRGHQNANFFCLKGANFCQDLLAYGGCVIAVRDMASCFSTVCLPVPPTTQYMKLQCNPGEMMLCTSAETQQERHRSSAGAGELAVSLSPPVLLWCSPFSCRRVAPEWEGWLGDCSCPLGGDSVHCFSVGFCTVIFTMISNHLQSNQS